MWCEVRVGCCWGGFSGGVRVLEGGGRDRGGGGALNWVTRGVGGGWGVVGYKDLFYLYCLIVGGTVSVVLGGL